MKETSINKSTPYRWVILAIVWMATFMTIAPQFQVAALAYRLIPELNLSPAQFSMIFTAPMFSSVFLCIPAGTLGDRFGPKKVLAVGFVLSTIAVYFRYLADNFILLFILMFLTGIGASFLNANLSKIIGTWFSKEQMGTAMGIIFTGTSVGMTVGLSTSALFPTTKMAFTSAGYLMLAFTLIWIIFVKDSPEGTLTHSSQPSGNYLGVVIKSRNIWLVGLSLMLYMGFNMIISGNLANALNSARGIDPTTAGLMASLITTGNMFGSFIGPMISDRIGRIKPFLAPVGVLGAILIYLSWNSSGTLMWLSLLGLGFLMGISYPLLMSFPILLPEIGPAYAGSAGGFISTLQLFGAFFIPSFIITPIAGKNFDLLFLLCSGLYFLFGVVTSFLPELGAKAKSIEEQTSTAA